MGLLTGQTIVQGDFVSTASGSSDQNKVVKLDSTGKIPSGFIRFGGDGSDGALSISSGTTTIDCANAAILIKNYTSISITGTGKLTFSNPHANGTLIVLKSQGNVTITSGATCIDASAMGASSEHGGNGNVLTTNFGARSNNANGGGAGGGSLVNTGSNVTTGTGLGGIRALTATPAFVYRTFPVACGAGGGGNNSGNGAGNGGGALVIECGGAWNFTTASGISVAGQAGTTQAGGGGGGGCFVCIYNSLTANSGTVVVTGGAAAANGGGFTGGAAGGDGNSLIVLNKELV